MFLIRYEFNSYAIPPFLTGLFLLALGISTFRGERGSTASLIFFLLTLSGLVWLWSYAGVYSARYPGTALLWAKIEHLGVVFIPSLLFFFTAVVLKRDRELKRWIFFNFFCSCLFSFSLFFTTWFIPGVNSFFWGFYASYGPLSFAFLCFFFLLMAWSLKLYWKDYKKAVLEHHKRRARFLLIAFAVAHVGAVDYLAAFGFNVYPFGYIPIIVFIIMVRRVITMYHFGELKAAFALDHLLHSLGDPLVVIDQDGITRLVNDAACRFFKKSGSDMIDKSFLDSPDSRFFTPKPFVEMIANKNEWNYEVVLPTEGRFPSTIIMKASPVIDATGKIIAMIYIARDITNIKAAQKVIIQQREEISFAKSEKEWFQRSERQLRLIADAGPTLISYVGSDGRYVWANKIYEEWFGLSAEEARGRHLKDIVGESAWPAIEPFVEQALSGRTAVYEQKAPFKDGARWVHATYTPDFDESGDVRGFVVHATDITELKRIEENLLKEKTFSESIINGLPGIFYLFDKKGKFLRWNRNLEQVSGYSSQEISIMNPLDFFRAEEREVMQDMIARVFKERRANTEANLLSKNGKIVPYYFIGFLMFIDGAPYLIGEGVDITERKKAENALHLSEARFRALFEHSLLGIQILSPDGHILQANHAWETLWGSALDSLKEYNILHDRYLMDKGLMPYIEKGFSGEATETPIIFYEPRKTGLSSKGRWIKVYIYPIKVEARIIQIVLMYVDVTHVAEFGSDVAHELKTPLAIIRGELELAEMKGCDSQDYGRMIKVGLKETHRMLSIVEDLLLQSKLEYQPGSFEFEQVDFSEFIREAFEQARKLAEAKNITVNISISGEPIHLTANKLYLRRLFMNLLSNAVKFTPEKGSIDLMVKRDKAQLTVAISDTGIGIRQEDIPRVFERFFHRDHRAEKNSDIGFGLGLSMAQSIARMHRGIIAVESKPGSGSTFTVKLPL